MNRDLEQSITDYLVENLGHSYRQVRYRRSGTGCINETWEIYSPEAPSVFLKLGRPGYLDMYQRESEALELLQMLERFRVPYPLGVGQNEHCAFLLMEFIPLGPVRRSSEAALGEALAEMHGIVAAQYGFEHDNYIGRSNQINGWSDNWWAFFAEKRIGYQLDLAKANGMRPGLVDEIACLAERLPMAYADFQPEASLLHGDLWSGNIAVDPHGVPTIYDPALYYGDAETDIAMSQMFGALGQAVYDAYYALRPMREGAPDRQALYDLYHWLNHFNLFGVTYLGQVERCVAKLKAALG